MKLVEMTVKQYAETLKSDAPAPGGGSAGALCGAQGAALAIMVCELTKGKKKYEESLHLCESAIARLRPIYCELLEGVDRDTEAFNVVADAFKLPKDTDEEKAARRAAIDAATVAAARVPSRNAELCLAGLEITAELVGRTNAAAASDLGVAALNLLCGLKSAYLNVLINLSGDEADSSRIACERAAAMAERAEEVAGGIYEEIRGSL